MWLLKFNTLKLHSTEQGKDSAMVFWNCGGGTLNYLFLSPYGICNHSRHCPIIVFGPSPVALNLLLATGNFILIYFIISVHFYSFQSTLLFISEYVDLLLTEVPYLVYVSHKFLYSFQSQHLVQCSELDTIIGLFSLYL